MPAGNPVTMAPMLAVLAVAGFTAVLGLRAGHYSYGPTRTAASPPAQATSPLLQVAKVEPRDVEAGGDLVELAKRDFIIPVVGIEAKALRDHFDDKRGSARRHEAIDIMAPRGTPVVATAGGKVVKLFNSVAGGLSVYQFDPEERFVYYYAHLDRYAPDLVEGKVLKQGDVLGFVGSTGNAPESAPHLHFTIFKLTPEKKWWKGKAINPFPLLANKKAN